jgi:homoserine kinase
METVSVRVPATAANLGPGFDCLGLALGLYMNVKARISDEDLIVLEGEGMAGIPRDPGRNLVLKAADSVFRHIRERRPPLALELISEIPVARGLGSSAAAIVAGICLANAMAGFPLREKELLKIAVGMEGHPDNVIPAYVGGFVISALDGDEPVWIEVPISGELRAVLFVPKSPVSTEEARRILPRFYSREDCVFNIGRAAMAVASLALGRFDMLGFSMRDRIHQPYRAKLMPYLDPVVDAALGGGAFGAALSGSGSAVLALCHPDRSVGVVESLKGLALSLGMDAEVLEVRLDMDGAVIEVDG